MCESARVNFYRAMAVALALPERPVRIDETATLTFHPRQSAPVPATTEGEAPCNTSS